MNIASCDHHVRVAVCILPQVGEYEWHAWGTNCEAYTGMG
jgi:hypothetical protein